MAGRGVQLRAKFGLSSSPYFGSRSWHVPKPEALPPPAPAAHALLCIADHRVGGRWSRQSRGTPGQKPYCNPDSNSLSHHGHPPLRLKPTVLHLRAHPRVAQSVRSPSHRRLRRGTSRYIAHSITCPSAHAGPMVTGPTPLRPARTSCSGRLTSLLRGDVD